MESVSYLSWFVMACKVFGIAVVVVISMAVLFIKKLYRYLIILGDMMFLDS